MLVNKDASQQKSTGRLTTDSQVKFKKVTTTTNSRMFVSWMSVIARRPHYRQTNDLLGNGVCHVSHNHDG
jgi:hypothetical protein